jgi:hypothetical protein
MKFTNAQQAQAVYKFKNAKEKLLKHTAGFGSKRYTNT